MRTRNVVLTAVAGSVLMPALPVAAQDAGGPNIAEIIVTARKREESILKVPVIETVVSREALERYQITDLGDLSAKVPGLVMGAAVLSIGPQVSIRGVGTSTLDAGVDQSVSLNLDGLSMTQGLAYKSGLFDLAQAEVLKGPQALFFGKNSPGGVISLRTADPGNKTELIGRVGYEYEAEQRRGELIFSTPVTDTFGVRLAGLFLDSDGFFDNKATAQPGTGALDPRPKKASATRSEILRGTAVWQPSAAFDARLKLNWTKDEIDGDASQGQLASCPEGKGAYLPPPINFLFINPNDDCKLNRNVDFVHLDPAAFPGIRNGGRSFMNLTQKFGTLEMTYRPAPKVTLTSVTGHYRADTDTLINGTQSGYAGSALSADNAFYREDFTQEFRGDTEFDSPVNFTAGAYYQDGRLYNLIRLHGNTTLGLPGSLGVGSHQVDIESYSLFGQARWKPIEQVEIAGGVRWTDEKRSDTAYNRSTGTPVRTTIAVPEISSDNYSPEFTLTYTPTDDLTLFGSLKRGYKSGSYTITTPVAPNLNNSFGDEKVDGGEIGLKSRLLERTLSFNVAYYYYVYDGLQVGTNEPAQSGLPIIRTINAGEAKIYGVDLEATYSPPAIDGLSFSTAVNWNHARFTRLEDVPCWGGQTIALGCDSVPNLSGLPGSTDGPTGPPLFTAQDLSGLELVRAPDWQVNAGAEYGLAMGSNMELNFGIDAQYSSHYRTALNNRKDAIQDSYTLLNANVTASAADDSWEVALIGSNITNEITSGSCTTLNYAGGQLLPGAISGGVASGPSGLDELTCVTRPGREVWLRLTFRPLGLFK